MQIHLSENQLLLPEFKYQSGDDAAVRKQLEDWLAKLTQAIETQLNQVYYDFSLGTSRFRLVTTAPTSSDLEEGELVLFDDGTDRRIYSMTNGSVRYMTLT